MVTLKDIAKECNVSLASVSKALNGHSDIGVATSERIRNTAKRMGYLPNAIARTLKTNHSNNIGVLFVDKTSCGLTHEYFAQILNSVKEQAEKGGYDVTFISKDLGNISMDYYDHAKYRRCDGVVIASVDFTDPAVIRLVNSEIPTVTLDYTYNCSSSIMSDNVTSMQDLVSYVYLKGHTKIAFIHGEDTAVTQNRLASFLRTCTKFGINVPKQYIKQAIYHDPVSSEKATKELLSLKERPTCILYPDDFSFIGGLNEIKKRHMSIPEDISVVGFDGIMLSEFLTPQLTTYKQDAVELGKQAIKSLIDRIQRPEQYIVQQIVIKGKLVEGQSVKQL